LAPGIQHAAILGIMSAGKVLMEGTPQEIITDESVRRLYLGDTFVR
jgi:ABC-type lipopolysaccharide export system ATPase subunit